MRSVLTLSIAAFIAAAANPASALSSKECSTKYQAAKTAGTLNGQKWNDYRKAECSDAASPAAATTAVPNPVAPAPAPTKAAAPAPAAIKPAPTVAAKPMTAPAAATGSAAFPRAVDPKYSSEAAGKARMHTCLDGYKAAKASGTLGDMKWIEKGGGYYSQCNSRLKS